LRSFANFLSSIRRAYLDLGSSTSSNAAAPPKRTLDPNKTGLAAWEGVRWLTDKERDEIDFAVKVALRKSVDRVRQLEQLEKGTFVSLSNPMRGAGALILDGHPAVRIARLEAEKRDNPSSTSSGGAGALSRLLGLTPATSQDSASTTAAAEQALAQHRSLITFYLNALLADVSQRQRDQQEARVQRQLERAQSLGALGANVGPFGTDNSTAAAAAAGGKGAAATAPIPSTSSFVPGVDDDDDDDDDNPLGSTLTAEQVQQFEAEESALLKATQTDLDALHKAESSLLEIAALQTQLVSHLMQQSELTDQLWEDAITVSGEVERGNKQLKQAKERSRDSRIWLLVFLFGSSFTLLFLDYYT
jgi:syntaxin 18